MLIKAGPAFHQNSCALKGLVKIKFVYDYQRTTFLSQDNGILNLLHLEQVDNLVNVRNLVLSGNFLALA